MFCEPWNDSYCEQLFNLEDISFVCLKHWGPNFWHCSLSLEAAVGLKSVFWCHAVTAGLPSCTLVIRI